ncbi:MAG TPA: substrate-binding domain-containing protein [Verrucomicrobiae bacterium]|nr:substrate-binding domain-containing protein [Verrucomicrobiae bacterium]
MSSANDHDTTGPPTGGAKVRNRLAEIRRKRGVPASTLARQAGISRQTIYAMEAGDYVPNTAVALRLARALEVTVEELFRLDTEPAEAPRTLKAELVGPGDAFAGSPVALCRVGRKLVAVPVFPAPLHFPLADGLVADPSRSTVHPLTEEHPEGRLLIAGCDPSTSLLSQHLAKASVGLVAASVNSSAALDLLRKRLVHVAGTHLAEGGKSAVSGGAVFVFAIWEQGLIMARGNPKRIRAVEDLSRPGVRLANRETGSGSRQLLDRRLKAAGIDAQSIEGYSEPPAPGHLAAAWRVYSGLADCCLATRCAARAFGLDFLPLTTERYDLVVRREHLELAAVERFLDVLSEAAFRRELEGLCGYDTRETGRRVA